MRFKTPSALLPWLFLPLACSAPGDGTALPSSHAAIPAASPSDLFGHELGTARVVALAKVLDDAPSFAGRTVVTRGVVEDVCAKKGCWMLLRDGERTMRVTFKDYGFFVPMDIHGQTVTVDGVFSVEEVSAADLKHYLEDAGRDAEAAAVTGPEENYLFEATGVRVQRAGA